MRVGYSDRNDRNKDKKKKKKSTLQAEIFAILQKGLKAALDMAMDDIFKEWK